MKNYPEIREKLNKLNDGIQAINKAMGYKFFAPLSFDVNEVWHEFVSLDNQLSNANQQISEWSDKYYNLLYQLKSLGIEPDDNFRKNNDIKRNG